MRGGQVGPAHVARPAAMDVPHVDAMDDPPVRTPARIGVLNQGVYPLLHPPPHADPDLEYPTRV